MRYVNLTPHKVEVYQPNQFINLDYDSKCYYADDVKGEPLLVLPSEGTARISQTTEYVGMQNNIPTYQTKYGELELLNSPLTMFGGDDELLVVSLPTAIMAAAAGSCLSQYMVSPYGVVRSRQNGSLVLGCQGFTFSS